MQTVPIVMFCRIVFALILVLFASLIPFALAADQATVSQAVQTQYDRLGAAFKAGDEQRMAAVLSADFQEKAADGATISRDRFVREMMSLEAQMKTNVPAGATNIQPSYSVKIASLDIKGDNAIVLSRQTFAETLVDAEGNIGVKGSTHTLVVTINSRDTWIRKNNQWLLKQILALSMRTQSLDGKPLSPLPTSTLSDRLDAEVSVEGYRLQPPRNYTPVPEEEAEDVSSYAWVGAARKDGTRPLLMLNLIAPAEETLTLEQAAQKLLADVKKQRRNWTQTRAETVTLTGLMFLRIGWTGTEPKQKRKMQGFIYVARDGDTFIELVSQDVTPAATQSLPLAEASIRTFKKPSPRVFFSVQWPDHAQIYAMNPDGSERVCLTPHSDSDYHPALSPDGVTIAFSTHRDGVRSLYLMNADGTNQRQLTQKVDAGLCSWSPDGSRLAFSSNRDGRYCIYVMDKDGSKVRRLTGGPSEDCPTWSADGRQIAYEGMQNQIWRIFVVNVDGSGQKPLTGGKWNDRWPQPSPDGSGIAYTSYEHGNGDIYFMLPDGTKPTRLTTHPAEDRQPSWTADSRQILFHSSRAGKFDLYALDLETLAERRLTTESKDTAEAMTWGRSYFGVDNVSPRVK